MINLGAILSRFFTICMLALGSATVFSIAGYTMQCHAIVGSIYDHDVDGRMYRDAPTLRPQFGVEDWIDGEGYGLRATDRVPLEPGTTFGWQLPLPPPHDDGGFDATKTRLLHEQLILPDAPELWAVGTNTRLSIENRIATTESALSPWAVSASNRWTITPGDPSGQYEIRVFLDGELLHSFHFLVE